MNIRDVLYMRNTGKLLPRASIQDKLLARKLSGGGVEKTATGNPVSIVTNKAQNAISTLLSYSPKQSGTGDPSPSNVRPIEGWTEANLGVNSETPTKTISLGGTYYGFSIDVERGVLRGEWIEVDLSTLTMIYNSGFACWVCILPSDQKAHYVGTFVIPDVLDAIRKPVPYYSSKADNRISVSSNGDLLVGNNSNTERPTEKAYYKLATPLELPLTPQTVALLSGANTLWTDGDSLSVTYKAKK